jgi:hypothetical protein
MRTGTGFTGNPVAEDKLTTIYDEVCWREGRMNSELMDLIQALECQRNHQTNCKMSGCKYYHTVANLCMTGRIMTDCLEILKNLDKKYDAAS